MGRNDPVFIRDYIVVEAHMMGVDSQIAQGVVKRESSFNCKSVGDGGTSYGCWQIHLPAHPEVTKEQAKDPVFSTQWSLNEIKKNGCGIWSTCKATMKHLSMSD